LLSGRVWSVRSSCLTFLFDDGEEAISDGFKGCDLPAILARIGRAILAALRFVTHSFRFAEMDGRNEHKNDFIFFTDTAQ
jgi:hypothetical protein